MPLSYAFENRPLVVLRLCSHDAGRFLKPGENVSDRPPLHTVHIFAGRF